MADNNSFFSKKLKSPSSFDGIFDGDGYNSFYVAGVEVARVDAQGLKLSSGTALRQGDAPAGGAALSTIELSSVATPTTLVSSQSGQWFTNAGTVQQGITLPTAAVGLLYNFVVPDSDGVQINAAGTNTIRMTVATSLPTAEATAITTAGGYISSTLQGSAVSLLGVSTAQWVVVNKTGVWSPLL